MIKINKDYFNNIAPPDYILCKANKERIGVLKCTEKTLDIKFNDIGEISFRINLYTEDNTKNPYYEAVEVMKYILLPDIGFFCISSVTVESEGTETESKMVEGREAQCLFAQRYLELFAVNTGQTGSIGEENNWVTFYNIENKERSLLHLVLEKFPNWSVGHVDPLLCSQQRTFEEIARQDVYSFLTTNVAEAFQCIFVFNTLNNTINAYAEETLGADTNLHVSYNNLLKSASVSCSTDDIKTCLTLYGQDDMDISAINMGFDEIYNFDYYNSMDFWSESLYHAYNQWAALKASRLEEYNTLQEQDEQYIMEINYLTNEMMPESEGDTDWSKYGLKPLQEQMDIYERKQNTSKNDGNAKPESNCYDTDYILILNTIKELSSQIDQRENQINLLQAERNKIKEKKENIADSVSIENNFTADQLKELYSFIREDELSTDNFLITDAMSQEEKIEQRHGLLEYGEKELAKISVPQLSFTANIVNLFAIPEFSDFMNDFDVGNYIWVSLRDDYSVKARLLSAHINFYDLTDFTVTFGNIVRKAKNIYTDITEAIKEAKSAAASVSFNSSAWNKANETSKAIDRMLSDGLLNAGVRLQSANSEIEIDSRGIFVNTAREGYTNDSIYIGDSQILFTQDNWLTVEEALGRVDIDGESVFGVIAKAVLAGHILGSTVTGGIIKGNEIYGNTITVGGNNNENGAFIVLDENGSEAGRWDCNGIVFPPDAAISWDNVTGTDNVAYTSDIPTKLSQLTNDNGFITASSLPTDDDICAAILANRGTIITKDYIGTLKVVAGSVACENLTGTTIKGKRFVSEGTSLDNGWSGELIGINMSQNDGWAVYAGSPLEDAVEPYTDQRVFNIGHDGEMYAQTGMFKYIRLEDRCAAENAYLDFVYTHGSSEEINKGTIYQDASAFRINSNHNIELNANSGEQDNRSISIYGDNIVLGGTVYDTSGSAVISSDRNLKHSIETLDAEKSAAFIYSLTPCKFKYNSGTSGRYHHGLIAQEVKEAMENVAGEDWGLYVEYASNGESHKGLRNEELIADLIAALQTQNERIKALEKEIFKNNRKDNIWQQN